MITISQVKSSDGITFQLQIKALQFQNGQKKGTYFFIYMDKLVEMLKFSLLKRIFKIKMLFFLDLDLSFLCVRNNTIKKMRNGISI